jgi:threonine synthase
MEKIYYKSTRGHSRPVSAAEAIIKGIAGDGGLFVPDPIPPPLNLTELAGLNYRRLALHVMKRFLTDFSDEELSNCIAAAYDQKFDVPEIVPLTEQDGLYFLELYHGPTLAFKDMALSILPHLLRTAVKKTGISKEIVILTATSGDTGKAALQGFAGVPGTRIIVFFPEHGVSQVQKRQMVTQDGSNTHVIGIEGNFDHAQNGVKEMFTDAGLIAKIAEKNFIFSSANSINVGRLIPQIVYYVYAYLQVCARGDLQIGEEINFTVPTGNFGNILAGYYAAKIGVPVKKLICASNENNVLYDFFRNGIYDIEREFTITMSPSMDILISSNLERLLYMICGQDGEKTKQLMRQLSETGRYEITGEMRKGLALFFGGFATEDETAAAIRDLFQSRSYLIDTHTAVACAVYQKYLGETGDRTKTVVVSTASPYKFTRDVMKSIHEKYQSVNEFELIRHMSEISGLKIPDAVRDLDKKPVLHKSVCRRDQMKEQVERILDLQ